MSTASAAVTTVVTVIITNYRTPALLARSFGTVNLHYPGIPIILVDNGDSPPCADYIRTIVKTRPYTLALLNSRNVGHGPGMHQALQHCLTRYAFTFDTDCEMKKRGLLELMLGKFDSDNVYAVGSLGLVNERGLAGVPGCYPYIHPSAMMIDREKYLTLDPFIHHGAPCLLNMRDADRKGYELVDLSPGTLKQYYSHDTGGTLKEIGGLIPFWNSITESHIKKAKLPHRMLKGVRTEIIRCHS
jgi:hypothetical protein